MVIYCINFTIGRVIYIIVVTVEEAVGNGATRCVSKLHLLSGLCLILKVLVRSTVATQTGRRDGLSQQLVVITGLDIAPVVLVEVGQSVEHIHLTLENKSHTHKHVDTSVNV